MNARAEQEDRSTRKNFTQEKLKGNDRLEETIHDLKKEVERLRIANKDAASAILDSNVESTDALQLLNEKALRRADEINKSLMNQHEIEINRILDTHSREKQSMLEDISCLKKSLFESEESRKALQFKCSSLQAELETSRLEWERIECDGQTKVSQLETILHNLENTLQTSSNFEARWRSADEENMCLHQKVKELELFNERLHKSNTEYHQDMEEMKQEFASAKLTWLRDSQTLQEKIHSQTESLEELNVILFKRNEQLEANQQLIQQLNEAICKMDDMLREKEDTIRASQQTETNFREFVMLKKQLNEAQNEVERLKSQIKALSRGQFLTTKNK